MARRNRKYFPSLIVPLFSIVMVALDLAAHAQVNANPPRALGNAHSISGLMASDSALFSPPLIYSNAGDNLHAVLTADLNGDHKADVIVANSHGIGVMMGNGDGTLQTPVMYSSGAGLWWPGGMGAADLRKNGALDIVVANAGGGEDGDDSVGVLLGNGDGTFQPAVIYDSGAGGGIGTLALSDLNRDGRTDIILFEANAGSARLGAITVLLGNGDGTFQSAIVILENTGVYGWGGIAVADLNSDGNPDLIVSDPYLAYIEVLLGNGDGTFQPPLTYGTNGGSYLASMAVDDVNGDGKLDILVGNLEGDGISVLLGNGDGTFQRMHSFGSGIVDSIAVSDVNGDGKKDLVVTCCSGARLGAIGVVGVLLGNGDGTFQDQIDYGVGAGIIETMAAAVADMNGDGKMDVVAADLCYIDSLGNCVPPGAVSVLLNNAPFCTTPPVVALSATPTSLWPPNGKMVPVTVSGTITGACTVQTAAYAVKDEYGRVQPSGTVALGAAGNYSFTVWLQAARLGTDLNGRLYKVIVSASNNAGKTGSKVANVVVPHDLGALKE